MRHRPRSVTSGCQPAMLSTPPVVLSPRLLEPELQVPQCEVYAWPDLGVREGCFSEEVHAFPAVDVQMPRNNIQWNTMQINDLEKAPKLFCENIKIGYSNEYFVMALSSGSQATFYSLTPEHAKRLQMYLTHEIENFEKKHRPITAEWNPNVVSPVQKLNPPTEGS